MTPASAQDVEIKRLSDGKKTWSMSTSRVHTVKPGLRPGKKIILEPGAQTDRKFSAFVTSDCSLAFQNHEAFEAIDLNHKQPEERLPTGSERKNKSAGNVLQTVNGQELPAKYIGCGEIFQLEQPGHYNIAVRYQNNSEWSTGEPISKTNPPAWIGQVMSDPISVELKKH